MEPMEHVIGTYNMSFMSDLSIQPIPTYASEGAFLARLPPNDRRAFWKNALAHLESFIVEKEPSAVGLQEMNLVESAAAPAAPADQSTGSQAVDNMLKKFPHYVQVCQEIVVNANMKPALSIIFDTTQFGTLLESKIVDSSVQSGRPILMVLTDKNFLLINVHGAQKPTETGSIERFNEFIATSRDSIITAINSFIGDDDNMQLIQSNSNPLNMFIMGDFNDRYDEIKAFTFNLPGIFVKTLKYKGLAPLACCYNWDSSCTEARYKPFPSDSKYGTCDKTEVTEYDAQNIKLTMHEDESKIGMYRYRGDKVFGESPIGDIQIYKHDERKNRVSTESDHELVFATFGYTGSKFTYKGGAGSRKRSRKTKKRAGHRSKRRRAISRNRRRKP
jgi:hypothetical protein